jgi:hypothetical protein
MTYPAVFSIVVGIAMIGQWLLSYQSNQIPELVSEPIRIGFHIAGEIVTALMLIAGGIGFLLETSWGLFVYLVALGMLFYTAIVSPGYFAQKGQWLWVGFFAILIVMGIVAILQL